VQVWCRDDQPVPCRARNLGDRRLGFAWAFISHVLLREIMQGVAQEIRDGKHKLAPAVGQRLRERLCLAEPDRGDRRERAVLAEHLGVH
jgi:hypothetical protein